MRILSTFLALALGLSACAGLPEPRLLDRSPTQVTVNVDALLPADVLLLGEQHDAPEHHLIEQQVIEYLAVRGLLGAVVLEMADAGRSTKELELNAEQEEISEALRWNSRAWSWQVYGPVVLTAFRAGVPVLGGNLPVPRMRQVVSDAKLDAKLSAPALQTQQQLIRANHCDLIPESQVPAMTRVQIARDISMAQTIASAHVPGKVTVLVTGSVHADKQLGVPVHLPVDLKVKSARLLAGGGLQDDEGFDAVWPTPFVNYVDHCAEMQKKFKDKLTAIESMK